MGRRRLPLVRGAASSGCKTIHSPPSVRRGAETSYRRYCRLLANKLEDPGQPQGPIYEQALRLIWYELEIDGSTNQDQLQRWLVALWENPRQYKSIFGFYKPGGIFYEGNTPPGYKTHY